MSKYESELGESVLSLILSAGDIWDEGGKWRQMRILRARSVLLSFLLPLVLAGTVGRKKRSIPEFGDMIQVLTGRNPMDFNGYGHFCGLGGKGIPVDPIDECCRQHDMCYHYTNRNTCSRHQLIFLKMKAYTVFYNWVLEPGLLECTDEDVCARATCQCDAEAALCFQRNLAFFDPRFKTNVGKFLGEVSSVLG